MPQRRPVPVSRIHITPKFHYDVAYLRPYAEYRDLCVGHIAKALDLLEKHPEYRFLVEQTILLEEYLAKYPKHLERLRALAKAGRFAVAPGMYVMPDMNLPDGESFYRQVAEGKRWLADTLGLEAKVCWIADCWGHHAQLPQMLGQLGYEYYVFWRCMDRRLPVAQFHWRGIDGSSVKTHWLGYRGYGHIRFPHEGEVVNAADLNLAGCSPDAVRGLARELSTFATTGSVLLVNGGDFMEPQASAPSALKALAKEKGMPPVAFATPAEFLGGLDWKKAGKWGGEFNSALQGTFSIHPKIKQDNRRLAMDLLAQEALAAVAGSREGASPQAWRLVLKQQFHDIICGSLVDSAVEESHREHQKAEGLLRRGARASGIPQIFNPLSFPRTERVEAGGARYRVTLPPFGLATLEEKDRLPRPEAGAAGPWTFQGDHFRAELDAKGFLTALSLKGSRENLVRSSPTPFGSLGLQMDYGDPWCKWEGPVSGGSRESALTQNESDPWDRSIEGEIVNRGTQRAAITGARAISQNREELVVEQEGLLAFWTVRLPFKTTIRLHRESRRIEYRTVMTGQGKHYRVRAAFPTAFPKGRGRFEIPFGIQARGQGEHVAQNWVDCSGAKAGVALLNRGLPGNAVEGGILLLSLMRSVAMEYKTQSAGMFQEGIEQRFEYAIVPHRSGEDALLVREGRAFNQPPLACRAERAVAARTWELSGENVFASALKPAGEGVFLRLYEACGEKTAARLRPASNFGQYAFTDGLENPSAPWRPCPPVLSLAFRPFEIKGILFKP
ncbi:MAG: alpha-mannosidase [Spirochaetes bacterium]|nr:alpha-mannosidase [Spirochaetota bacterium]